MSLSVDTVVLAAKVREKRSNLGLTKSDLASLVGSSPSTIGRIEAKKSYPSTDLFISLCNWLKTDPRDFVRG